MPKNLLTRSARKKTDPLIRLASFTQMNPRPVVEVSLQGKIMYTNTSAITLFPQLQKKALRHPYLAGFAGIIKELKKGAPQIFRDIQVEKHWFRQFFYYLPDFKSVLVYGTDVTDRKEIEDNLVGMVERYKMLFEKMNYAYGLQDIIFDKNGRPLDYRFIDMNPAFEKMAEMQKVDVIGKSINELSGNTPKTKESIENRKKYDEVARTGKPLYMESYNPVLKKYFKIYAYKPNQNQISLIFRDITKEKETEEAKNNFIAMMSHELRNPLTPILANAQFMKAVLEGGKAEDTLLKESLAIIEKEAKIMANLLNDILDVARLRHNKITLEKRRVDVREIVQNASKACLPFINTKQQTLSIFFDDELYANADPLRVEQILINLINNASKYTQERGHISVHAALQGGFIELRVKDNGSGMDKKKMSKIFDIFSEESQPFLGVGGLGIGLNIVKNLVAMHGGKIAVKSAGLGKGSEFAVTLPVAKGGQKKPRTKTGPAALVTATAQGKLKVLIVEDNADIRSTLAKVLERQGYQVKTAGDGKEAVMLAKLFKPNAGLIDIGLPGMNGYEVAKALRARFNSGVRLIAVTGYGQSEDKRLAKAAGFDHHVTKPVDIGQLGKLLTP